MRSCFELPSFARPGRLLSGASVNVDGISQGLGEFGSGGTRRCMKGQGRPCVKSDPASWLPIADVFRTLDMPWNQSVAEEMAGLTAR